MDGEAVLRELESDRGKGLSAFDAKKRIDEYGYNELKKEKKQSPVGIFFNQFNNILVLILLIAIALSIVVGEYLDAAIIGVIVFFVAILGFVQEYRAERALEALKKMLTPSVTVLRDGVAAKQPTRELVPGDVLVLEAGDKIPADARLIEAHAMKCDEAPLTGESVPAGKFTAAVPEGAAVNDRKCMVFTGTTLTYGRGLAVVTTTGMKTELGKIAEQVSMVKADKTPLEKRTEEIGKWLGIIVLVICVTITGVSIIREIVVGKFDMKFLLDMVMFGVALAVSAVPEALAAIVTGALAIGMHRMAKRNALVRKMSAVETLGCTTVICSDKTGTLTKGEMTVRRIVTSDTTIDVGGAGYEPTGGFTSADKAIDASASLDFFFKACVLCNDAGLLEEKGKWSVKGDPTEAALLVCGLKAGYERGKLATRYKRIDELPFSPERKRMTTIHEDAEKSGVRFAMTKGAPEYVLDRCVAVVRDNAVREITDDDRRLILKRNEEMAEGALRVLGFAYREMAKDETAEEETVEKGMIFLGLAGMIDPPRQEAIDAVRKCKHIGIKPVMITGDHKLTAVAIAREVGIFEDGDSSLSGEELDKMPDEDFAKIVDKVSVYARVSPMDKLKIVNAWKSRGEVVAMTGDGVNDAPALKHADIGIAMGITGTEVTKEAADMVLNDDNFATIIKAIEIGRWIYENIKKYLAYLLQCNITEVAVIGGVVMILGPEFLPLLPAAILYINLATDGLPALALGMAPADKDIMERPPRNPKESIFSGEVKISIFRAIVLEIPFFFALFFMNISQIAHARTLIFFLFIIIELAIALNMRSLRFSVLHAPPHALLVAAVAWEIVLITVLVQFAPVREAFGINLPSLADLGIIVGFAFVIFAVIEALKLIFRKRMEGRRTTE